jgi:cyclopropane-fatty-acyl-phospholipid synthase
MEFFVKYIQKWLPDWLIRIILQIVMRNTIIDLSKKDFPQKELRLIDRIKELTDVTFDTDAANEQHYQVPTDFFLSHLGEKLKYSSCEWTNETKTLEQAEQHTINEYQKHLQLDLLQPGDIVLEIGNGWGSLCLSNAKKYPHLNFESFSNSETQIEFITTQIEKHGLINLTVWKQDIDDFVKNTDVINDETNKQLAKRYSRIVSIECIEHCRAYNLLFRKLRTIMKDDGFCFFQILGHREYSYLMNNKSWMGRNFFTGGTIPSMHLFHHFNEDLVVTKTQVINGGHYARTLDAWLHKMYNKREHILSVFKNSYGNDAEKMYQGWRMFYLMCSESFGYNNGKEWCVGYITMKKR